jgi:SAM-dependent methyltransferase
VTRGPRAQYPKSDYKEYPKTLAADDFWGQVRRTVHGKAVSKEQIRMIVCAIQEHLDFQREDTVLDLACGNGALSRYLFDSCRALLGVDHSDYLIEVAKTNFEQSPDYVFVCADAARYVESEPAPERFTKALCYGSFSFLPAPDALTALAALRRRFTSLRRLYLGNLPDKDRAERFYPPGKDYLGELDDHTAQIGIWRSRAELAQLCAAAGWRTRFVQMPLEFFGSHYRYDAVLEPDGS